MKKVKIIAIASALAILTIGISTVWAASGTGRYGGLGMMNGFNTGTQDQAAWQTRHDAMEKALENNDYAAWAELMAGRGRVTELITEQNFSKFVQMHDLMEAGKYDEASVIRQELGLGLRGGFGRGCPMHQTISN